MILNFTAVSDTNDDLTSIFYLSISLPKLDIFFFDNHLPVNP